jgi:hypothetical protein
MSRTYDRNFDIPEDEDFELNVAPFINPGERVDRIIENCGVRFCGVETEHNPVLVGWNIYQLFKKEI